MDLPHWELNLYFIVAVIRKKIPRTIINSTVNLLVNADVHSALVTIKDST